MIDFHHSLPFPSLVCFFSFQKNQIFLLISISLSFYFNFRCQKTLVDPAFCFFVLFGITVLTCRLLLHSLGRTFEIENAICRLVANQFQSIALKLHVHCYTCSAVMIRSRAKDMESNRNSAERMRLMCSFNYRHNPHWPGLASIRTDRRFVHGRTRSMRFVITWICNPQFVLSRFLIRFFVVVLLFCHVHQFSLNHARLLIHFRRLIHFHFYMRSLCFAVHLTLVQQRELFCKPFTFVFFIFHIVNIVFCRLIRNVDRTNCLNPKSSNLLLFTF